MPQVIVAFETAAQRDKIAEALTGGGIPIKCTCQSGAEALRLIHALDDAIVVCGAKLSDQTADQLAHAANGRAGILVIAAQPQLEFLEHDDLFRLPFPLSRGELLSAVKMLMQMVAHRNPNQRSERDRNTIDQAKQLLMRTQGLTEAQAHHFLQRASMESGRKITDVASTIIQKYA